MIGRWLNRILILNIIVQSAIIATGAIVRVSGSGLGCPSWPQCTQGSYIPTVHQEESWHKWVEYGNRTLTGILMIVAVAVASGVWLHTRNRTNRLMSLAPLGLTFGQAILGGITVLTGLNPYTVASHFLLSTIIVVLSVRLWWRVKGHEVLVDSSRILATARQLLASASVVIFLGVVTTGSGPHSGDAKAEARFSFDPSLVAKVHSLAVLVLIFSLFQIWKLSKTQPHLVPSLRVVSGLVTTQALVGIGQFALGLPALLVAIHVALAASFWASVNVLYVQMTRE
jgi:cytochrome c oxidase assembly protein subunit 15